MKKQYTISEENYRRLKMLSKAEKRTMSAFLERLIEEEYNKFITPSNDDKGKQQ